MASKDDEIILIVGGIFGVLIILAVVSILIYIFATREEKTKKEEEPEPAIAVAQPRATGGGAARTAGEEPSAPASGCPSVPYTYCSRDTIKNVYIVSGCGPSSRLIEKLTTEGKITGEDDPKVINCSQNSDLCTAAEIQSYPSVICENSPSDIYQGYCE